MRCLHPGDRNELYRRLVRLGVRLRIRLGLGVRLWVWLGLRFWVRFRLWVRLRRQQSGLHLRVLLQLVKSVSVQRSVRLSAREMRNSAADTKSSRALRARGALGAGSLEKARAPNEATSFKPKRTAQFVMCAVLTACSNIASSALLMSVGVFAV